MKKLYTLFILLTFATSVFSQPASWNARGIGGGGALFSPSINPGNGNEYYISCDMSELFHSVDFGQTYSQVNFQQFTGGHNSKVCFTATPHLLYSISYINDVGTPVKSNDNGFNWTALSGNPDASEDVVTIDVDYNNPSRIIISTYGAIYFSGNSGVTFTQFHTAVDGGAGNVVGGVLFDSNNIYVGTNDGVLVSTNFGTTWTIAALTGIPSSDRIWSFTAAKVGGVVRFYCLTGNAADIYVGLQGSDYYGFCTGIYSCDYSSSTAWVLKTTGINLSSDFPMFIDMAQNDLNTVYLAGSNDNSEPIIMKTTNAGGMWNHTFLTASNQNIITGWSGQGGDRGWSYGECPFGFDVSATNSQEVIFGDFGFCHKTIDGGATWQQAYVNTSGQHPANAATPPNQSYTSIGLENTTCWQVNWPDANNMWACYSDIRGIRSTDAGNSWSYNYTGTTANSSYRLAKSTTGRLYMGTSNIHDMYQSTRLQDAQLDAADANGKLLYSDDNGATWLNMHTFGHSVFWVALDPSNSNRGYASVINYGGGVGGVYRCNNLSALGSSTWTQLPAPPRTEGHPASLVVLNDGKLVATYSGRRDGSSAFTASSGVFIYDPVGNSWADVSDAGMHYWTKDVVIDPNDATQNTWYVCVFSGWGGPPNGLGGLYRTTNRGTSWTKLTGTSLDRVTSCTFNPNNANELYITTETQGLWRSADINATSPTISLVGNYPFRQPERVFFNPYNTTEMWVTSFGNGMKMGTLLTTGEVEFANETVFEMYPNPATDVLTITTDTKNPVVEIYNVLGEKVGGYQITTNKNEISIADLKSGIYFVTLLVDGKRVTKKLVKE
ncbi:MAG: BNR/Asp-box repeat protein [Bacteroidetes bacterium]|nr:BNR/Asp-box repeat protein [Bacteroidota bacterium]